jgi:hypothetical protein
MKTQDELTTIELQKVSHTSQSGLYWLLNRCEIPTSASGRGKKRAWPISDAIQIIAARRLMDAGLEASTVTELLLVIRTELARMSITENSRAWLVASPTSGKARVIRDGSQVLIELESHAATGQPVFFQALHCIARDVRAQLENCERENLNAEGS